jgi:ABC-type branched-subunit amino acid transport system ATPase component
VSDLNANYGSRPILFDIEMNVRRIQCVALVGESSSGKGHDVQYRHWEQILLDVAGLG